MRNILNLNNDSGKEQQQEQEEKLRESNYTLLCEGCPKKTASEAILGLVPLTVYIAGCRTKVKTQTIKSLHLF